MPSRSMSRDTGVEESITGRAIHRSGGPDAIRQHLRGRSSRDQPTVEGDPSLPRSPRRATPGSEAGPPPAAAAAAAPPLPRSHLQERTGNGVADQTAALGRMSRGGGSAAIGSNRGD